MDPETRQKFEEYTGIGYYQDLSYLDLEQQINIMAKVYAFHIMKAFKMNKKDKKKYIIETIEYIHDLTENRFTEANENDMTEKAMMLVKTASYSLK